MEIQVFVDTTLDLKTFSDQHEVIQTLGSGMYSETVLVYKSMDRQLYVAKINNDGQRDWDANLEMQAMLKLRHPSIPRIRESYMDGTDKGLIMVTEYYQLGSLEG